MRKKGISYIVTALILIVGLLILQYSKPRTINWFESYVSTHKIPYGTFVANELLENRLYDEKVRQIYVPPFEFLSGSDSIKGIYAFVNNRVDFEEAELNQLLEWTAEGNTLFIASEGFEETFRDTLGFEIRTRYAGFEVSQNQEHQLVNPYLKSDRRYTYNKESLITVFEELDTINASVLATVKVPNQEGDGSVQDVTAIKSPFGKGEIILSTFPKAFTNYFVLENDNRDYTAGILSYFGRSENIYMDNYYKSGKSFYTSPMYIFLNTKELKWAYYMVLIGGLIYIVFEGKRKQRPIPVVKPLQNQTLAFTRTISDMYFEKGDGKSIAEHKINYFLNYIKTRYYIGNITNEDYFYSNVSARSGNSLEETKILFKLMDELRSQDQVSEDQLKRLNNLIQKFKSQRNGK
ncbi:DUF4350 domain-containing protein [Maribacter sp. 4G9]|uniref:DUF4350 domain-containing protein n=1 Tax=Maribacter sp. 4G9 TaxID=1889777 RepID=UPI000C15BC3B|nr:DUF4350 domain-containing protein [Maribacter sp. 4G9]PIB25294.1 hypothetical protein BFP75_09695 [Maribacter sp. 4G9]